MSRSAFVLVGLIAVGCVKSSDVKTANIQAQLSAVLDANGTVTCRASLMYSKGGTLATMVLTAPDQISCSANGLSSVLTQNGSDLSATLGHFAATTAVQFTLKRANNETVVSTVMLPADFSLFTDAPNQAFSVSTDRVDISVSPQAATGVSTSWSVVGDCINPLNDETADSSGASIAPGTITMITGAGESCSAVFTIRRQVSVSAAPALASASVVVGALEKTMDFNAAP